MRFIIKTLLPQANILKRRMSTSNLTLQHVLVLHRHGDRSPILVDISEKMKWSDDVHEFWRQRLPSYEQLQELSKVAHVVGRNISMPAFAPPRRGGEWPCGQLTQKGVDEMQQVGKKIYDTYKDLLVESTDSSQNQQINELVYVESTNVFRTIESVQCLLKGMMSSGSFNTENCTSIPIHTMETNILAPAHSITVYGQIEQLIKDEIDRLPSEEKEKINVLSQKVRQVLDIPQENSIPWTAIRDGLVCMKAHNIKFPIDLSAEELKQLFEYDEWLWYTLYCRKEFLRSVFTVGSRFVLQHLEKVVKQTENGCKRMGIFSVHDNSIVALLHAFQLKVGPYLPPYGCTLALEMYCDSETNNWFIKVKLQDKYIPFKGYEHETLFPFSRMKSQFDDLFGHEDEKESN